MVPQGTLGWGGGRPQIQISGIELTQEATREPLKILEQGCNIPSRKNCRAGIRGWRKSGDGREGLSLGSQLQGLHQIIY